MHGETVLWNINLEHNVWHNIRSQIYKCIFPHTFIKRAALVCAHLRNKNNNMKNNMRNIGDLGSFNWAFLNYFKSTWSPIVVFFETFAIPRFSSRISDLRKKVFTEQVYTLPPPDLLRNLMRKVFSKSFSVGSAEDNLYCKCSLNSISQQTNIK